MRQVQEVGDADVCEVLQVVVKRATMYRIMIMSMIHCP
jgi:hypothetical protein